MRHPTPGDPFNPETQAHIAMCRECNPVYALSAPITDLEYREAAMRLSIQSFGERTMPPFAFVQRAKYFEHYLRTGEPVPG